MKLENTFTVAATVVDTWAVLDDLKLVALCLPGAQIESVEGEDHHGSVKIKLGPVTITYRGTVRFVERDADRGVAVLRATAKETRGSGNVKADITATLLDNGDDTTHVSVVTDLSVTGRAAQFGSGLMADVSARIFDQFASRLSEQIAARSAGASEDAADEETAGSPVAAAVPQLPAHDDAVSLTSLIPWGRVARGAVVTVVPAVLVVLTWRRWRRRVR
jgi:carbon monoxide dehydrogenase subunit G